jgi:hypothetical protein
MPFKKGEISNPAGRPIGAKNRLPRDLVDRVLQISADLDKQGKGLGKCAEEDPFWFFQNFLKPMIPKNVSLAGAELAKPVTIEVAWVKAGEHA